MIEQTEENTRRLAGLQIAWVLKSTLYVGLIIGNFLGFDLTEYSIGLLTGIFIISDVFLIGSAPVTWELSDYN